MSTISAKFENRKESNSSINDIVRGSAVPHSSITNDKSFNMKIGKAEIIRNKDIKYTISPKTKYVISSKTSTTNKDILPIELKNYLTELQNWGSDNKKDSTIDTISFWSLKIPAILSSSLAGLCAHFKWSSFGVILGAVASICVIIDGIHPRGMLRNIHLKAYHDISILTRDIYNKWRTRSSKMSDENTYTKLIKEAQSEEKRISKYLSEAETSLKYKD